MSIHAIGKAPQFIDSNHISSIRPCKQRIFVPEGSGATKDQPFFGVTVGGHEILFREGTPGLDELLHCWYGPGWSKAAEAIDWSSAGDITGMGYEG